MDILSLHDGENDSPAYSEFSMTNLSPMTTLMNSRYDKEANVTFSHMVVDPTLFLFGDGPEPMYLPLGWAAFTHPEGQTYFHRSTGLRVITEACIYRQEILEKISSWASSIEEALKVKGVKPSSTTELFLEPYDGLETCGYYFVDHSTRSEFWLDQVSTEALDLGQVVSISHLKMALEQLYWVHVEYFPMHFNCVSSPLVDKLIGVFSHGQTDRMTSTTSTFPYDIDACVKFIRLLKDAREREIDGHTTCIVARLWSNIVHGRLSHHFGQESPRLERVQSIIATQSTEDHWTFRLCTSLCFGLPEIQYSRFNKIYVDHQVDMNDFRKLMTDCMDDWKSSLSSALPLLISNILLSSVPSASQLIGLSSIIMCGMSAISSMTLSLRHDGLTQATGGSAYNHLAGIQSDIYGFRPSALVFSLPRALYLWGLGLLMTQAIFLTIRLTHPIIAIGLASLVLLVVLGTRQVIYAEQPWRYSRLLEDGFKMLRGYSKTWLCHKCGSSRLIDACIKACQG